MHTGGGGGGVHSGRQSRPVKTAALYRGDTSSVGEREKTNQINFCISQDTLSVIGGDTSGVRERERDGAILQLTNTLS